MNWLTNIIRPKIRSVVEQKDVPDNLWHKCPSCEGMLFHRDLEANINVCYHCNHHMRIDVTQRLELLFDEGLFKKVALPDVIHDPLKFKDRKKYADRLKDTRSKTKVQDAIMVAKGTIGGKPTVIAAFDFRFMGGSMGAAVGEGIVTGAEEAVKDNAAFIVIPSSGGARMQEGMISLMQMPRTIVATSRVKEAGLPYIVLLADPTTGGVSASFAMTGDIHIAEPGCTIGFAGKRVIQETIREELPEGFQTAEYLLDHGMIDMVVARKDLHVTLSRILDLLFNKVNDGKAIKDKDPKGKDVKGKADSKKSTDKKNAETAKNKAAAQKKSDDIAQDIKVAVEEVVLKGNKAQVKDPANTNAPEETKQAKAAGK